MAFERTDVLQYVGTIRANYRRKQDNFLRVIVNLSGVLSCNNVFDCKIHTIILLLLFFLEPIQKLCLKIAKIENCQNWHCKLPKLKIAKIASCQSWKWFHYFISIFDELSWKLPKLKVAKIESCQNWKLPKLEIAKIESWKDGKVESDFNISC